ncbi:MAG: histidine kinase [Microbacterium sp.]
MRTRRSRGSDVLDDAELRLPRPPGVIRRYWARHPLFADVLIALVCLLLSSASFSTATYDPRTGTPTPFSPVSSVSAVVLILASCGALLVRRRSPLVPLALALLAQVMMVPTPSASIAPTLAVAVYSVAVYRSNRMCWLGYAIASGAVALVAAITAAAGLITLQAAVNAVLETVVTALFGALVGVNVGNRKRYLAAIIDRSRQLLVERDQRAQLAAAEERARIAREMHDIVSHSLTVIVALAEGAAATSDIPRAREAMDAAATTARDALTEMRATLGVLRDGGASAPLRPAEPVTPQESVAAAQRAGYPATLTVSGDPVAPPSVRYAVSRIVQEGLTNAMRHAPDATTIHVRIDHAPDRVRIEVANDGVTAGAHAPGFGIRGLAERAAQVGGTLHSGAIGGGRWLLHADLPIDARETARTT